MKHILFILSLFISTISLAQKGAVISFEQKGFVFDSIPEGTQLKVQYIYTNTGDADLYIKKVKATCGCTVVKHSEKALAPGQTDTMNAVFDTNRRVGHNAKGINIETNAGPVSLVFQVMVYANPEATEIKPAEYPEEDHSGHKH